MSKIWGIPGLRIGYAYTRNTELRDKIRAEMPIWNMNSLSEYFMELVLKYRSELDISLQKLATAKKIFVDKLHAFSFIQDIYSDCDNYILATLSLSETQAHQMEHQLLTDYGFYIKNVTDKFKEDKYSKQRQRWRLAVNTSEDNTAFLTALTSINHSLKDINS